MIKRIALLLMICAQFAVAQTTTAFSAHLKDLAITVPGSPESQPAYIELTLRNCAGAGTNPTIVHVNGGATVVFPVNLYPDGTGLVSKSLYDERQYVCGSSASVAYYHIRIYQGDSTRSAVKKLLFEDDYDIQGATFVLDSATPRSGSVITPPVATAVLTNPAGNQTIVQPGGTALSVNFLSAGFAQNANGADMIPGQRFTDTSPTGNFLNFKNAALNTSLWQVDVTGQLLAGIIPIARLSGGGSVYQTFQNAASALTQRATANFFAGITCADNAGATRTDCRLGTLTTVTFSATPTFDASTASTFKLTLTANVTSSTLSNAVSGEPINIEICQDATGGRTFVPPANVLGWVTIPSGANACIMQDLVYDGSNAVASSAGTVEFSSPPPIGNVTPNSVAATTLSATGTSTLANAVMNGSNTGSGAALTIGGTTTTTGGISVFVGASGAQNERLAVVPADGSVAAVRVGALSVRTQSGGFLTGTELAKLDSTGLTLTGSTSGTTLLKPTATASGTLTLPAATDTLVGKATTDTLTNKTLTSPVITTPTMNGTVINGIMSTMQFSCTGTATAATTLSLSGGPCTNTSGVMFPVSSAATMANLRCKSQSAGVNASSGAVTVRKNGVAQTTTCTIGAGTTCSDLTHSFSVAAGDTVDLVFTTQTAETVANIGCTVEKQ